MGSGNATPTGGPTWSRAFRLIALVAAFPLLLGTDGD
jgi:hypothetical protein